MPTTAAFPKATATFNFNPSTNTHKVSESEVVSRMIDTLSQMTQFAGKKEIEVRVDRSGLAETIKHLLEQFNTLQAQHGEVKSENCSLKKLIEASDAENIRLKDTNRVLNEELKNTKMFLTDTRVELERMKTHFDILERKYIDLLK